MNHSSDPSLTRIDKILSYIHRNIDKPLSLDILAKQSCWSRWQLQRVFHTKTGVSVAQYVRELKLSLAAEKVLSGNERIVDLAFAFGFNSEISFSRAFKQYFGLSPRDYKKIGKLSGIRKPLTRPDSFSLPTDSDLGFCQIRLEHRDAFKLVGLHDTIHGPFSSTPDFSSKVPEIWHTLLQYAPQHATVYPQYGIIDTTHCVLGDEGLVYWASIGDDKVEPSLAEQLSLLTIPQQTYAVLPVYGPISNLANLVEWFMLYWLPNSEYQGVDGYELEVYDTRFSIDSTPSYMEYWLPIQKRTI